LKEESGKSGIMKGEEREEAHLLYVPAEESF
jgi:hypothetical protein